MIKSEGMNKLQTLKGFRDFLPKDALKRAWLKEQMIKVFEKWGFEPLETPTLEPLELFAGEIGEDEKLFFKFKDPGGRDVALRYDQTVPTVRVVGEYYSQLTFPFRRYQIQSAFRAEKPQKGRYREFIQADIDILGVASPIADAECIAVSIDLYRTLGFKNVVAIVNNRNLLKAIPYPVIAAIDKIEKIGKENVIKEIVEKGYKKDQAARFLKTVQGLKPDKTLKNIFEYLDKSGFNGNYKFEPTLMRSFSYSEGPIWEMTIPEYSTASFGGSVGGGERYDSMVKRITGIDVPATGIAFGFDRTLEALEMNKMLPDFQTSSKILVTVFSPIELNQSIKIAKLLRENGVNTELYPDDSTKLDKQLKYADKKGIPYVAIIGPEEVKENKVVLKNLKTKEQIETTQENLISLVK